MTLRIYSGMRRSRLTLEFNQDRGAAQSEHQYRYSVQHHQHQ